MSSPMTPMTARAYQDVLLDEAAKDRVPGVSRDALVLRIGNLLISVGLGLLERYEPAIYRGPEAHPSPTGKASGYSTAP